MMTSLSFFKGTGYVSRLLGNVSLCALLAEGLTGRLPSIGSHRVDHGKAVPVAAMIMTCDEGSRAEFCSRVPSRVLGARLQAARIKAQRASMRAAPEPRQEPEGSVCVVVLGSLGPRHVGH